MYQAFSDNIVVLLDYIIKGGPRMKHSMANGVTLVLSERRIGWLHGFLLAHSDLRYHTHDCRPRLLSFSACSRIASVALDLGFRAIIPTRLIKRHVLSKRN